MTKYKLLSIDAWADCTGCGEDCGSCWTWNNWHTIDTIDKIPDTVKEFIEIVADSPKDVDLSLYDIEDDQYNVVLVNRENRMPIFAVEYGSLS